MHKLFSILVLMFSFSVLVSCGLTGEEIARLPINEVSTSNAHLTIKEAELDLIKGDKIAIWPEMDFKHEGELDLLFKIEVLKNGEVYGLLDIDLTDKNIAIGELKTAINGKTNWRFSGKNSQIAIKEDGTYTFTGILTASENPTLDITKAEVVLKI